MRFCRLEIVALLFTGAALAQSDRGTITGTVSDSSGAVVPSAAISAKNTQTGAVYEAVTTATGNYALAELPAGVYSLTVSAAGFTNYIQQGIQVEVAQTLRVDAVLQVGAATESVTVTADASLLRTDSSDVSHNITQERINELPIYGSQLGASGLGSLRSPYAFIGIMPGANLDQSQSGTMNVRVNGLPNDTYSTRVEGQEATDTWSEGALGLSPGVDALQEVTLQTSNFAAEYGQVAGGLFNFTAKSGTNQLHGNAFEFWRNEDLNAGQPFTNSGNGHLLRPVSRSNDWGGSVGGPVYIPHVYNGHNKTFFYFNIDRYPSSGVITSVLGTVPTLDMRNGNFSEILTGRNLATDTQGNAIMENTVYDPATLQTVNGKQVTTPFPGNMIPQTRFDPIAAAIQALLPPPTTAGLVNNWQPNAVTNGLHAVVSGKVDENISVKSKLAFYISVIDVHTYLGDGLAPPITTTRNGTQLTPTIRLSYDRTITPTFLVHAGIGFIRYINTDNGVSGTKEYNAPAQLGLVGGVVKTFSDGTQGTGFPEIQGLLSSYGGFSGGVGQCGCSDTGNLGLTSSNYQYLEKPTGVLSAMFVRSNHTYKAGAEWRKDGHTYRRYDGSQGVYNFSNIETALPSTNGQNLSGGAVGFPYASFLLGAVDSASIAAPEDPQFRRTFWAMYAQDTWKITRRLTFDYGLRWDYETALTELWDRYSEFSPTVPNPSAGGLLGGLAYAGSGPGRIGGEFTKNYPYAIGPRLGVAYQITPKTVLRAGWGVTYGLTGAWGSLNTSIVGVAWNTLAYTTQSYGQPAVLLHNGLQWTQPQLYPSSLNPGFLPLLGQIQSPPNWVDPQGGRPPRISQWNIALQREITTNLAVEAAYVGNRAVWLTAGSLLNLNALTPQRLASVGLNATNAADDTLLTSALSSSLAASRGFSTPPYASFPLTTTVAQSLRPFPQFSTITAQWPPLGNSWYDSLQAKLTKRTSHGLTVSAAFSWQKELQLGTAGPINDVYNRPVQKNIGPSSLPFSLGPAFSYTTPRLGPNRWIRLAIGDWTIGGVLRYQSGLPIQVPAGQNALSSVLFQSTFANRVPGVPLFTQNLNCHCFDPNRTFVLNPAAWTEPGPGQFGTAAAYYNDYRYARRPAENASLSRSFRIRERMRLEFRAIFNNPFNRTYINNPTSTNALATQSVNAAGQTVSGFGYISTGTWTSPRSGLLEGRFEF
jgi:hypothetical protein